MLSILTGRRPFGAVSACVGALLVVCTATGCDKVPLLAPSGTTITLSTNSTIVQSNGSAQISATMLESSGTPVQNGTTVTFSTNLGRLSPAEARTLNGVATVEFHAAGSSGVAEIRATSGAAKPADATNPSVKITIGAAAAGRISLTASPSTVSANGGSSTISAAVADTAGNVLRDVAVSFSTTAGTLSTSVANTDANGNATTTLTTNRETTVTASTGAGATAGTNTATVIVKVNVAGAVVVTVAPNPALVGQAVAVSVTLTASASGSPFQRGTVEFGDGSSTTIGGSSTTVQHTYTRSGTYVIRATAFDAFGDSATSTATTPLVVTSAPKPTVSISASATPTAGGVTTFTFGVTAASGTTIESVSLNFGDGSPVVALGGVTGAGQTVQHVYPAAGTFTATITAEDTAGASASASTVLVVQPLLVSITSGTSTLGTITFTAVPSTGVQIASYTWNFEGSSAPVITTSATVTHTFTPVGAAKEVTVTATSTNGQTATGRTTVVP